MIEYEIASGEALAALQLRTAAPVQAIPTPWGAWNQACRGRGGQTGLALGWHLLVAGKSGGGKTFMAANLAATAMLYGEAVTFHSLEMDWDELTIRLMGIVSGIPTYRLSPGEWYSAERFRAARAAMDAARGSVAINTGPMYRLTDIVAGITRAYEQRGSRLHLIDYLQLAWSDDAASRYERITEVSHAVRRVAKELRVVTVGLSQLNRDGAKGGKPQKESMDGGGPLEADSDQVLLLDHSRRRVVSDSTGRPKGWSGWAVLDKNRHGPEVELPIQYDSETGRIRERLPDEIMDDEVEAPAPALRVMR